MKEKPAYLISRLEELQQKQHTLTGLTQLEASEMETIAYNLSDKRNDNDTT